MLNEDPDARVGKPEVATQRRVIALLEKLGYAFLGHRRDRVSRNLESALLRENLRTRRIPDRLIGPAIERLREAAEARGDSAYGANMAVYELLYYGIKIQPEPGANYETVFPIDWQQPRNNHFAVAEEVSLREGRETRRPDLVLYLNGIAVAVIELKSARVSVLDAIGQLISNQKTNPRFFNTVQILFAGNDSEGLRYGTLGTPAKYYQTWKGEKLEPHPLDGPLAALCAPDRLLTLLRDFVLFDAGVKKVPRPHQFFAVEAATQHIRNSLSGVIWHTQGSGKSLVMVLLARWVTRNLNEGRVLILTDREELDKQIEGVFRGAGETTIHRANNGKDFAAALADPGKNLICSLIHKFGTGKHKKGGKGRTEADFQAFLDDLERHPPKLAGGRLVIFVDECHRSQNGRLHQVMKTYLPDAVLIGFTGTPLLKKDQPSLKDKHTTAVFGGYIHTYKFNEAVKDGVVLDLVYESRSIIQEIESTERVDAWFEAKTRGLTAGHKQDLQERWATMRKVIGSQKRGIRVMEDVELDFATQPGLSRSRGTAILVAGNIAAAARYYEWFQQSTLAGKVGLVTSYDPRTRNPTTEDKGTDTVAQEQALYKTYVDLLENEPAQPGQSKAESYVDRVKKMFVEEPANCKLLIVVNKLLTGFDAPSCTYLYLDKELRDHGLFQAICRTNRLDGPEKPFGYIVDYRDLFERVKDSIGVYTSDLADTGTPGDDQIFLRSRLQRGRELVEEALNALELLCRDVPAPRDEEAHLSFFCGSADDPPSLEDDAPKREALYKWTAALLRGYSQVADDPTGAGYDTSGIAHVRERLDHFQKLRDTVRLRSADKLDLSLYEADMQHLIDRYIEADPSKKSLPFGNKSLLDVVSELGVEEAVKRLPSSSQENGTQTVANNLLKTFMRKRPADPAFFDKMSAQLAAILAELEAKRIDYQESLRRMAELLEQMKRGGDNTPPEVNTDGKRALFHFFEKSEEATEAASHALTLAEAMRNGANDGWRGNKIKQRRVKKIIRTTLTGLDDEVVETLFNILVQHTEF